MPSQPCNYFTAHLKMATAHGVVGFDFCSLTGDSNTVIANVNRQIPNHNHVTSSTSNLKLSWTGDFQSLKDFVHTVLRLKVNGLRQVGKRNCLLVIRLP